MGVVGLVLLAACGTPQGGNGAPRGDSGAPRPDRRTAELASEVVDYSEKEWPEVFSSAGVQAPATIVIHRVPSEEYDQALRHRFPRAHFEFRRAARALIGVRDMIVEVSRDVPYWRERGVEIAVIAPLHDGSGVMVGTLDTQRAAELMPDRYVFKVKIERASVEPPIAPPGMGSAKPVRS